MPFKVVMREMAASGLLGEPVDLSSPLSLTEANVELAKHIEGRGSRPTSEGWRCEAADGSERVISLERC